MVFDLFFYCVTVKTIYCVGDEFELLVIGYLQLDTHVIRTSIARALMAFFSTVFKTYETCHSFRSKEVLKRYF